MSKLNQLGITVGANNKAEVVFGLEPIGFSPEDFLESSSLIEEIKNTGIQL